MKKISRRTLIQSGPFVAGACALPGVAPLFAEAIPASGKPSPIRLGLASYTFRNFTRARLIAFMKQLNLSDLNAKDATDHLPTDPAQEAQALADYAAAGIKLHAAGAIYFDKDDDDDIRAEFEFCRRAGINLMIARVPARTTLPRIEKFVKQYDIRVAIHNRGPEDKSFPSPFDVLKAVKDMDSRMGCCIDVGHAARAGANLVDAIHAAGPRLYNLHVKDLASFNSKEIQVAVGDGILPFREMFEALIAIRYPGFVNLKYEIHPDDPMPGVIASFSYMRGVLAGMGYLNRA